MLISPYYDEIKAGALDILHHRFSAVYADDLVERCKRGNEWALYGMRLV